MRADSSAATWARRVRRLRPWHRPDRRKYVIFAQGRTGTTLLGELLASHPLLVFPSEILESRVGSPAGHVERMRWRHPGEVFGYHVKIYQLTDTQGIDPHRWVTDAAANGWSLIGVHRDNVLRHVLSNIAAERRGRFRQRSPAEPIRMMVDPTDVLAWMRRRESLAADERAALAGLDHVALSYEQDLMDAASWQATADRVFSHIGVSSAPVASTLQRLNAAPLTDLIGNYDELAAVLTTAGYGRFLS